MEPPPPPEASGAADTTIPSSSNSSSSSSSSTPTDAPAPARAPTPPAPTPTGPIDAGSPPPAADGAKQQQQQRTPSPSSTAAGGAALSSPTPPSNNGVTGAASQAPGVGGGVVEDQLSKFKRLLTLSRQRLEENQRALAEKDGALSRLSKEGEALRSRVGQLQQQVAALQQQVQSQQSQQSQASNSGNGNGGGGGRTPGRALLRVDVSGRVWLLLEPEGEGAGREREGEGDYWQSFGSEAEATAFLTPPGRPPLPPGSLAALPPCLSPFESARVQAEAAGSVERAREELRRYRVRHEMLLRGKEAEIKQLSATALAQQTQRIDGAGRQDGEELQRHVKAQAEKIAALRQELAETEQRWRGVCEKAVREKEALLEGAGGGGGAGGAAAGAAADTALASQWRKRYESVVREREDLRSRLDLSGSNSNGPVTEQKYQDLKEEYRLYRKQALAALREKDAALAALSNGGNPPSSSAAGAAAAAASAPTAGGGHNGDGSLEFGYLRALCEKYFSTESPEIREHTERAMCTVLRFSEEEMRRMRAARGAVSSAAASSGIAGDVAQWASSLFSTGAAASTPGGASR